MQQIIEILMNRDGLSYSEARNTYLACQEMIVDAVDNGEFAEVDEILRSEVGLEPDYIFCFI
jgi:hypothetical protein